MTGKIRTVSCTLEKDTRVTRKAAAQILEEKIQGASGSFSITRQETDPLRSDRALPRGSEAHCQSFYLFPERLCYKAPYGYIGSGYLSFENSTPGMCEKKFGETGDENGTLNERLTRLKALIRWGYKNDYITDIRWLDKLDKAPDPEKRERLQDKFLEREELKELLEGMAVPKWRFLTAFLALSGLRIGESIAQEKDEVDFQVRMIHVTKTWDVNNKLATTTKTLSSSRDVYMQDELFDLCRKIKAFTLSECLRNGCRSTLLFCDSNGDHVEYAAYNKYLKEVSLRVLGRKVTPHVLRHTHVA